MNEGLFDQGTKYDIKKKMIKTLVKEWTKKNIKMEAEISNKGLNKNYFTITQYANLALCGLTRDRWSKDYGKCIGPRKPCFGNRFPSIMK